MAGFSERHGHRRAAPARIRYEEAPEDLRSVLRSLMVDDHGEVGAYRKLCEARHEIPSPNIWGPSFAEPEVTRLVDGLEWFEVFDLLEDTVGDERAMSAVNESFARTGLAYEMQDRGWGHYEIALYDPEGSELEVVGTEDDATEVLIGDLEPVAEQYRRALSSLRARPSDPEKAVSEAAGALEAVARVIGGDPSFAKNISTIFSAGQSWDGALGKSLTSLYGYASQVPGARHGRWTDPKLEHEEALYVVRACGSAIAFLASRLRAQT